MDTEVTEGKMKQLRVMIQSNLRSESTHGYNVAYAFWYRTYQFGFNIITWDFK